MVRRAAQPIGRWRNTRFHVAEVDTADAALDLIVAGMFEAASAYHQTGGAHHLDEQLGGTLARLRAGGIFTGRLGETLTLTTPPAPVRARAILLIGLGAGPATLRGHGEAIGDLAVRCAMRMRAQCVGCLLGWSEHDLQPRQADSTAASIMRGAINAADRPEDGAVALDWIFHARPSEARHTIDTLRRALNART